MEFIVDSPSFRMAQRSLREGRVTIARTPVLYDVRAGFALFATNTSSAFVHVTVLDGGTTTAVVMAFDQDGGWVFTDYLSGVRVMGDEAALKRLAAWNEGVLPTVGSTDAVLARSLLDVLSLGGSSLISDEVRASCAGCRAEQSTLNWAYARVVANTAALSLAVVGLASCGALLTPTCFAAISAYQLAAAFLADALITLGQARTAMDACRRRVRC